MSTAQNIVDEVRGELNDEVTSNFRFSNADMLTFVNAGQREIVTLLPEANIIEVLAHSIVFDKQTRHIIPADGIKFIKVSGNYDAVNTQRGPSVRRVDRDALDGTWEHWAEGLGADVREWPNVPGFQEIHTTVRFEHYFHDPREPTIYYLYPASDGTDEDISLVYCQLPADLTGLGDTFALDDQYQNAMVEYVLYRCLSRDGRYGAGTDARKELLNNFRSVLGLQPQQEERVGPRQSRPPEGP